MLIQVFYFVLFLVVYYVVKDGDMRSAVDLSACPPAWASLVLISCLMRLFTRLSNSLPLLLARVMPLSELHLPLLPLPL